jgi:ERCC4-type nuclease
MIDEKSPELLALAQRHGISYEALIARFEAISPEAAREIFKGILDATDATYEALASADGLSDDTRRELQRLTREMLELAAAELERLAQEHSDA